MNDYLEFIVSNCMPDELRLLLRPRNGDEIAEILGLVRGPFCEYSNTLTADYRLQKVIRHELDTKAVDTLVLEPCYWTPRLPFLYEFHLTVKMADCAERSVLLKTGVARSHCMEDHLCLNLKRIVLRGTRRDRPDEATLQQARECETALLVDCPDEQACELASRWGVPLVVDLRGISQPWEEVCRQLDWFPAVMVVLLSAEQLADVGQGWCWPQQSFVALGIGADFSVGKIAKLKCDLLAVELSSDQRPPAWITACEKPVIVIRTDAAYADMTSVRAGCDRLQADLAPEFDLAGYFVS